MIESVMLSRFEGHRALGLPELQPRGSGEDVCDVARKKRSCPANPGPDAPVSDTGRHRMTVNAPWATNTKYSL
jgi:hypothetical protein